MVNTMPPIARSLAGQPSSEAIQAPSALYLTGEEQLRITSIGNAAGVTVTVRGRVLRPDFDIAITEAPHTPNSNRTIATTQIALSEGWPLGFSARASAGTPAGGAGWGLPELVRGHGRSARRRGAAPCGCSSSSCAATAAAPSSSRRSGAAL